MSITKEQGEILNEWSKTDPALRNFTARGPSDLGDIIVEVDQDTNNLRGIVRIIPFSSSSDSIAILDDGNVIIEVSVRVKQAFNDINAVFSVGTVADNEAVFPSSSSDLTEGGRLFSCDANFVVNSNTEFFYFLNAGSATQGQVELVFRYG